MESHNISLNSLQAHVLFNNLYTQECKSSYTHRKIIEDVKNETLLNFSHTI